MASCKGDAEGMTAEEVSGDSTRSSFMGRAARISSTSRLGLLPPLCNPFRFGVVDEVTSGVGRRGLDRANISLGVGGGKGIEPGVTDMPSMLLLAGDTNASGVNKLKWLLVVLAAPSYSETVVLMDVDVCE